ncbi:MAG TPA: Holliday junction branch migration protein RuvA [Candidatus Onthomonas avicola]|nr:Holliday junction branch migration protein RuvA [Candidatus Onthomonas avicola]
MFYYLSGTVTHLEPKLVVIDCGGVGFACNTTTHTLSALSKGKQATLYTHLSVKEDDMTLYGFSTQEERSLFRQLISVSGVGPKAALAILSATTPSQLALSIITGDAKVLTAAPGVGKRIAQRVILELKDKLAKEQGQALEEYTAPSGGLALPEDKFGESAAALAVLGYSQSEINQALKGIDLEGLTSEQIIKQALKNMMK